MSGHAHRHDDFTRAFAVGIALNVAIVAVELTFGVLGNSMALISDGGHNLSDVLGLVVGWAGTVMAKRSPSPRFTYGLKKASILAALINALFLLVAVGAIAAEAVRRLLKPSPADPHAMIWVAAAAIVVNLLTALLFARGRERDINALLLLVAVGAIAAEAVRRLLHPAPADARTMIWVAAAAIVVNLLTALLFARGRERDINARAAFTHMAADAAVSAAVVFAGLVIVWTGQQWVDPVMSLVVAGVILWGSIGLLRESVGMSLMGVPHGIEPDEVEAALASLPGVEGVHHLHIWPLSTTETALTVHLVLPDGPSDAVLHSARVMLHDRFAIGHCTIQIEQGRLTDARC